MQVNGKTVHARELTAAQWFDAAELKEKREQDAALIAASIVDKDGQPVLTPESALQLGIRTWSKLYAETLKANTAEAAEKK